MTISFVVINVTPTDTPPPTPTDTPSPTATETPTLTPTPAPTPFDEDFESGTSNWTHPAGWLRVNTLYHSPTWAMQAGRTVTTPYSLTLTLNTPWI